MSAGAGSRAPSRGSFGRIGRAVSLYGLFLWGFTAALIGCGPPPGPAITDAEASDPSADSSAPESGSGELAVQVPIGDAPSRGAADALVTIVEFIDFECPFCSHVHPTIERLLEEHPDDVRWVVRHNPLSFHHRAVPAAVMAIEVQRQRGDAAFFEAADFLLRVPRLDSAAFQELLEQHRLDPERVARALAMGDQHPVLQADQDVAIDLEISGTPNFFINGRRVSGAQPYAHFDAIVKQEIESAKALLAKGVPRSELYARLSRTLPPPPGLRKVETPEIGTDLAMLGPADAKVTLQVFSDFECPYCSRVMPTLDALLERYPRELRIVWRHLPLAFHANARLAARAAEEAKRQLGDEGFWTLTRRMLGSRSAPPERLDRVTLMRYAGDVGLEPGAFAEALNGERHTRAIERDTALAAAVGIQATPGFVINGYKLIGAHPLRRFDRLVRLSLEDANSVR